MERFTRKGSPQKRPTPTSHTNFFSLPFSPKPRRHSGEPHTAASHVRPPTAAAAHQPRRLSEDTELGIFGAERYFNEGGGQPTEGGHRQKKGHLSGLPTTSPTASSEASWSSQFLSLSGSSAGSSVAGIAAKASLNKQRRGTAASPANPWPLGGACPCTRHKAVDVEERYPMRKSSKHIDFHGIGSVSLNKSREAKAAGEETAEVYVAAAAAGGHDRGGTPTDKGLAQEEMVKLRQVAESWIHGQDPFLGSSDHPLRHERFQFGMTFSEGVRTIALPVRIPTCVNPPDDPSRFSLEVFQPAAEASPTPRVSVDFRRLATRPAFPGDAGPLRLSSTFSASPVARVVASLEDELASDSSSDLFEIESFSTQATPSRPAHRRGSSPVGAAAMLRAAKTPEGSSSSRVSRQPRWAADGGAGCEEARPEREQQQNHAEHGRAPANSAMASDGPPLLANSHGSPSPVTAAGA